MTSSHIFYIPLILLIGFVLGLMVGRRSAELQRLEEEKQKKRDAQRKAREQSPPAPQ